MENENRKQISRAKMLEHMRKAYAAIPVALLLDVAVEKISPSELYLYACLLFRQGINNHTIVGVREIRRWTGYSDAQITRMFESLISAGHLRRTRRYGRSSVSECLTLARPGGKIFFRGNEGVPSEFIAERADQLDCKSQKKSREGEWVLPLPSEKPIVSVDLDDEELSEEKREPHDNEQRRVLSERTERILDKLSGGGKAPEQNEFTVEFNDNTWRVQKKTNEHLRQVFYSIVNCDTAEECEYQTYISPKGSLRSTSIFEDEDSLADDKANVLSYLRYKLKKMEEEAAAQERDDDDDDDRDVPLFG